jgi:multicomponent Na+:H+ antiporter subunit F
MATLMLYMIGGLLLALVIATARLVIGPSLANRVVALDVIAVLAAALAAVFAIHFEQPVFLDVTLVLALVSFVGTVAFAYYLEKRAT